MSTDTSMRYYRVAFDPGTHSAVYYVYAGSAARARRVARRTARAIGLTVYRVCVTEIQRADVPAACLSPSDFRP